MKKNKYVKIIALICAGVIILVGVCKFLSLYTLQWRNSLNISQDNVKEIVGILNQLDYTLPDGYIEDDSEGELIYPKKTWLGDYTYESQKYEITISKFSGKEMDSEDFYSRASCYHFGERREILNGRYYKMIETGEFEDYCWVASPLEEHIYEDEFLPIYTSYWGVFCIQNGGDAFYCEYGVYSIIPTFYVGLPPRRLSALEILEPLVK